MISKECFVRLVDNLRDYYRLCDRVGEALGEGFIDNNFTRIADDMMDALTDEVESWTDQNEAEDWLWYYAFDTDWGEAPGSESCVTIDSEPRPLTNAGQLYDLLKELRERNVERDE